MEILGTEPCEQMKLWQLLFLQLQEFRLKSILHDLRKTGSLELASAKESLRYASKGNIELEAASDPTPADSCVHARTRRGDLASG